MKKKVILLHSTFIAVPLVMVYLLHFAFSSSINQQFAVKFAHLFIIKNIVVVSNAYLKENYKLVHE